jgi:serine/threonine protein phosphatase PrpC
VAQCLTTQHVEASGRPRPGLISYLGIVPPALVVQVEVVAVSPGDRLLLVTDGVPAHLTAGRTWWDGDADEAAARLVELAVETDGGDNATALVVDP